MLTESLMILLSLITLATFVLNLPFGYLRGNTRKFSFLWFLYIHLPIPAIFLLRTSAGFTYRVIPILVIGAVIGQLIGSRLYNLRMSHNV